MEENERKTLKDNDKNKAQKNTRVLSFVLIPFVLSVPPIVGWALGAYLDGYFDTEPYLMYVFLVFGVIAGYREFYRIVKRSGE